MNKVATELIEQLLSETDHFKKAHIVDILRRQECISVKDIASKLKKHPSYVSHLQRLVKLPFIVVDGYYAQQIALSHLVILSRLKDKEAMEEVYKEVLAKGLTSVQTEQLIRLKNYDISSEPEKVSPSELESLTRQVKEKLQGVDVKVVQTRIKGKITLELKGDSKQTTHFLREVLQALSTHRKVHSNGVEELMILE